MKRKLKILRIITSLDPKFGGPSRWVLESSKQLAKEGFKVDIITCDKEKINFDYEEIVFPNNNPIKIDEKLFRLLAANSEMTIIAENRFGRAGKFDFDITGL